MEAEITAARPIMRPVERSHPLIINTIPAARAMIILVEDCARIFLKLSMDKNLGSIQITTMINTRSTR